MTLLRSFNTSALAANLAKIEWSEIYGDIRNDGYARIPSVLDNEACENLSRIYAVREEPNREMRDALFHRGVDMERLGYGRGKYGYLSEPLPDIMHVIQAATYEPLLVLANEWAAATGRSPYPEKLEEFHKVCADAGQNKSACLLLQYPENGYNDLHQDKYGPQQISFPFQMVIQLKEPDIDFSKGELILSDRQFDVRDNSESATRIAMQKGEAVIFPSTENIAGGIVRFQYHGVATVEKGLSETCIRQTAGIMWHQWGPKNL